MPSFFINLIYTTFRAGSRPLFPTHKQKINVLSNCVKCPSAFAIAFATLMFLCCPITKESFNALS